MNIENLVAIDVHTHAETSTRLIADEASKESLEARWAYAKRAA